MVACARGVPDVTILTDGVDVVAGTAHITADEARAARSWPEGIAAWQRCGADAWGRTPMTAVKRWMIGGACGVVALELFLWLAAVIGALTS